MMVDRYDPELDFSDKWSDSAFAVMEKCDDGAFVRFDDYEKLTQDYKTLNQINEANDNAYRKLMFDYQSLLIEYGKLAKGSK